MKRVALALVAASLASGCGHRGPMPGFAVVSTRALAVPMTVIARDVEGRSCIGWPEQGQSPFIEAVAVALRSAPGANALVNVRFEATPSGIFSGCTHRVRGTAVRIEPR